MASSKLKVSHKYSSAPEATQSFVSIASKRSLKTQLRELQGIQRLCQFSDSQPWLSVTTRLTFCSWMPSVDSSYTTGNERLVLDT